MAKQAVEISQKEIDNAMVKFLEDGGEIIKLKDHIPRSKTWEQLKRDIQESIKGHKKYRMGMKRTNF